MIGTYANKKIIITQSNYIPWKGYFDGINIADEFVVYDDMQYTKRDWRNRNIIKTANGPLWLAIPIEVKGKYLQKINESLVAEANWGTKHWKSIQSNYGKSPFYKEYKDIFEPLYLNPASTFLTDINLSFIRAINEIMGIKTRILDSREFTLAEGKTERLVEICKQLNATDYYTGAAAKNYMDEALFEQENIKVHYFDYSGYPEYPQLFPPFEHAVTVLDLLFNVGPNYKQFMKSFTHE